MKNKKFLFSVLGAAVTTLLLCFMFVYAVSLYKTSVVGKSIAVTSVSQSIAATGSIHSQQEATLHFQTGGKLVSVPFKQGDTIAAGQVIAQLDTYSLQKQLQIQANALQTAQNNNAQVQENNQASVVEGQTRSALDASNHTSYSAITEAQLVTDTVARIVANSALSQNTAQLQVDLANYALQLSSLTAPFSGVLLSEDVTTPQVNVTPTTSFTLVDPSQKVFRAQVAASDIDFVSVGSKTKIKLDGQNKEFIGTVVTVYPQKQTTQNGEDVYLVDISANGLSNIPFGQNGSVLIMSNTSSSALMVPTWLIVGHTSVWVWNGKDIVLRHVALGLTHGNMTEVTSGLSQSDTLITSPEVVAKAHYQVL